MTVEVDTNERYCMYKCTLYVTKFDVTGMHDAKLVKLQVLWANPFYYYCSTGTVTRVPNFEQKKFFAEDKTRRNEPLFRRNFACFAKQKTYKIPFRVIPRNRKDTGIFLLRIIPRLEYSQKRQIVETLHY
jgi:hypothetical protein